MASEKTEIREKPGAIVWSKAIALPGGGVAVVRKWSYMKALTVMDLIMSQAGGREALTSAAGAAGGFGGLLMRFGGVALEILKLSVEKPEELNADLAFEDMVEIADGVVELNLTEALVKKLQGLAARVRPLYGAAAK